MKAAVASEKRAELMPDPIISREDLFLSIPLLPVLELGLPRREERPAAVEGKELVLTIVREEGCVGGAAEVGYLADGLAEPDL